MKFPCQVRLLNVPDSEYARERMTVGNIYTALDWAGSCLQVTTDIPGDTTMIWNGRLEEVSQTA